MSMGRFAQRTACGLVCALPFALPAIALSPASQISQYAHSSWTSDAGITAVRRVVQTPDGYLWLGTREGLFRFDGVRFTAFKPGPDAGLESSTIQDLLVDPDGSLWIATLGGGLAHYQRGQFHTYTLKDGLPSLDINSLFRDSNGTLWVGTRLAGIARMVNGRFEQLSVPIPASRITSFIEDSDHSLWIATDGFGVFRLRDGKITAFTVKDGLPSDRVIAFCHDHTHRIWTAGWKGISSWNGARFIADTAVNIVATHAVSCLEDHEQNLWIGTTSGMVRVHDAEVSRSDRSTGQYSSDFIWDIFEDREGNLWLGTRMGLDRLRDGQVQFIGQPGPVVSDVQGIWSVPKGQVLRVLADTIRSSPLSLPEGATVLSVLTRPDGGLLIGSDMGVWIWTDQQLHSVSELSGLSVRSLFQDRDGSIWIGTVNRGLLHWTPSAGSKTLTDTGVTDAWITSLAQDYTGAIWAGSSGGGGFYRLADGKVQHFGRDAGLRSTVIYSLYVDKKGELWIGSAGGLSWFQDGHIRSVNSQQGLHADQVFSILEDSFDRIWLGGYASISVVDKNSLFEWALGVRHKLEPILYPFPQGIMESGSVYQFFPSAARGADGHLWFGGIGGLCEVTPSDPATSRSSQFPVLIEDITIDGVAHSKPSSVLIPAGARSIELRYTALTLSNPETVRFRYRLEGFDPDWVDAGTRRLAIYNNQKPDTYRFQVAARVGNEPWQNSSTLVLEQLPFFYQTWWFRLLSSSAGVSLVFFLYRLRLRQAADRIGADFQQRMDERARIVQELRKIIDSIPGFVCAMSADGEVELLNRPLLDYFGKTFEEMKGGWGINDSIHPDDRARSVAIFENSIKTGVSHDIEQRCRRADGVYRWFHRSTRPVREADGTISGWYALITDIEDRKLAEEELQRKEAFLAEGQLISSTGTFSWRLDTDEIVFSEEACRIFGFALNVPVTLERIGGRIHPDDIPMLSKKMNQARTTEDKQDYEIRLQMANHTVKNVHISSHLTRHLDGHREYIGAIQDVTERRRTEEALGDLRSELAHMARVTSLGALTASIVHEVSQPLSGIMTNAGTGLRMLSADPPNLDGARETVRRTIRDGTRATEVIKRLRVLFSKKAAKTEAVDLNEAAIEVLALCADELQRNRVVVRQEFADDLPLIEGDRVQLQQVMLNLLRNAADSMNGVSHRSKNLLIRTEEDEGTHVRLTVQDAGVGITRQDIEKLFDSFFTTKSDGMGMGLSISRTIIERHNGRLWATPNEGPGATFSFSIPCKLDTVAKMQTTGQ
jgi:PAS domain S-box-containing protein